MQKVLHEPDVGNQWEGYYETREWNEMGFAHLACFVVGQGQLAWWFPYPMCDVQSPSKKQFRPRP